MHRRLWQTQDLLKNIHVHNLLHSKPLLTAVLNCSRRQQREETWITAGRWSTHTRTHNCKYLSNAAHLVSPSPQSVARQAMSACGRTVSTNSSALYNSTVATATATVTACKPIKTKNGLDWRNSPTWIQRRPHRLWTLHPTLGAVQLLRTQISCCTACHMTLQKFFENFLKMPYKNNLHIHLI